MAFTIPNHADANSAFQAEPDSVDFDILAAGYSGSGVISGCAVTAQGTPNMTVAVAAGVVIVAGVRASVTGANSTIGTADGTNPRCDMITVNNSGTIATTAGTAASVPELPSIPANSVVIALIFVPANDTTIATAQITDKRVFVGSGGAGGVLDDIILGVGSDSDIAILNRSSSLSADAEVTNVIEGTSDHLGVAANSLIVSNITNDGDIMFVVSDGGNSKGLLKLDGANGRVVIHGGDLLMSGAQKIYFYDVGGEYMSSDGSTLTITGATALTPTVGSTAWANANHAHAASNSGGALTTLGTITTGVWNGTAIGSSYIAGDAITGAKIADNAIDSEHYTDGSIDTAHIANLQITTGLIAADAVTGAKIADDALDSEHYADGSIDSAHLAADVVTGAKIADDALDSEHYVDGSIDTAHLAADAVTGAKIADDTINSEHYVDGSIDTAHIADNQVTAAKLADIARGSIIYGNASAATAELTKGSANTVLTSDGTDISWAAAGGGSLILIGSQEASSCPSTLVMAGMDSTYDNYLVAFSEIQPNTNAAALVLRLGASGSIDDGASDYAHHSQSMSAASSSYSGCVDNSRDQISITPNGMGNTGGEGVQGHFWIHQPADGTSYPFVNGQMAGRDGSCVDRYGAFYGTRLSNIATAQVQLSLSSGTFKRGRLTVWGLAHA